MGFNRRKMEDRHRQAAEKQAGAWRLTAIVGRRELYGWPTIA